MLVAFQSSTVVAVKAAHELCAKAPAQHVREAGKQGLLEAIQIHR